MPTTGNKGKPVLAGSDSFAPYTHINNAVDWAETFASVRNVADSTAMNALSGTANVWVGLVVYHTSGTYAGTFWLCTAVAGSPQTGTWVNLGVGLAPRIDLTRTTNATGFFTSGTTGTVSGWTTVQNRGGFTESTGTVTVPLTGRYNITGNFAFGSQATAIGYRMHQLVFGGSSTFILRTIQTGVNGIAHYGGYTATGIKLTAGDTVALAGLQNSGVALDLTAATASFPARLTIEYVGA